LPQLRHNTQSARRRLGTLPDSEIARAQLALAQARMLVNPSAGILGAATGKSSDHPGEAALSLYVDEAMAVTAPATVDDVRTLVIPTHPHAVAFGSAPQTSSEAGVHALPGCALNQAVAIKQQIAPTLMKQNPAFFGVGVGQSLDNPSDPALVIYVDRIHVPAQLPPVIDGLRTRYIVMAGCHVTRSLPGPGAIREATAWPHPGSRPDGQIRRRRLLAGQTPSGTLQSG